MGVERVVQPDGQRIVTPSSTTEEPEIAEVAAALRPPLKRIEQPSFATLVDANACHYLLPVMVGLPTWMLNPPDPQAATRALRRRAWHVSYTPAYLSKLLRCRDFPPSANF